MKTESTHSYLTRVENERKKSASTNYFHTGNVKKVAGSPLLAQTIQRRRLRVSIIAGVIILIGLYNVFF